jgi:valyl-tRNA synthetase
MTPTDFSKAFDHAVEEKSVIALWDEAEIGKPRFEDSSQEPFSILMPPPNANASLHAGHAMYVIQDILVRWKRMQGHPTAWFPGTDHAGFESQFVYENHLKKQGKSRFQFDRETLFRDIEAFVQKNSGLIISQMKRLGFSADWSRLTFTLDEKVVDTVLDTFIKLESEGKIYRDNYLVNYCPKLGTSFSELEVIYKDQVTPLYYIRYRFSDGEPRIIAGQEVPYLVIATVRPETIFADVALAIHPDDPRAEALQGEFVLNPLTRAPIPVIVDSAVDPEFGTGMLKITPAHDQTDFAVGKRHDLPVYTTIDTFGKITLDWWSPEDEPLKSRAEQLREQFHGVSVFHSRPGVVALLQAENAVEKVNDKYANRVAVSYKGDYPIEPLPYPNWFLQMNELAELGKSAVSSGEVKLIPQRFTKQYFEWLDKIRDWPISRQIVWGIRMPVWYNALKNPDIFVSFLDSKGERHNTLLGQAQIDGFSLEEISAGLQTLTAPIGSEYVVSKTSPGENYLQETDTFDTWFSSGQWPLVTLGYPDGEDFKTFYPTSVLDSMWDILFFWIARMIMMGKYLTRSEKNPEGVAPFKTVYLHSMVTDAHGAKMSKSKGNVINPLDIVDTFGADALRIALVAGSAPGNPIALSEAKVKGYRNFGNKIWNIGRFIALQEEELREQYKQIPLDKCTVDDEKILKQIVALKKTVSAQLEALRFSDAALGLYDFIWNDFANTYLENNKDRQDKAVYLAVVKEVYLTSLKMLHPFMPFVTEAVWQRLQTDKSVLALSQW